MSAPQTVTDEELSLLAAARGGDGEAFQALVDPHLRALHLHCYRMLGSLDDAEEALQEGLLRAWRALDTYQGRAPLRHWLYRITTNTSLKLIDRRSRQPVPAEEISHLQPYPDRLLDQLPDTDPAAVAERRESVTLAFITALQRLPARQRAVLILRDVLAYHADEVAALLELTVPAVNSALQRARATLAASAPDPSGAPTAPLSEAEQRVLARFVDAWQRRDIPALAATLRDDVVLTMPPELVEIMGRDQVMRFLSTEPAEGRLDVIRLLPTRANGQPALVAYLPDDATQCHQRYGIMVFTVAGDGIAAITAFPEAKLLDPFGLPATLD